MNFFTKKKLLLFEKNLIKQKFYSFLYFIKFKTKLISI